MRRLTPALKAAPLRFSGNQAVEGATAMFSGRFSRQSAVSATRAKRLTLIKTFTSCASSPGRSLLHRRTVAKVGPNSTGVDGAELGQ